MQWTPVRGWTATVNYVLAIRCSTRDIADHSAYMSTDGCAIWAECLAPHRQHFIYRCVGRDLRTMEQRWCGRQARGTRRDTRAVVRINLITQRRNEIFAPWTNVALWRVHVQFILYRRRLFYRQPATNVQQRTNYLFSICCVNHQKYQGAYPREVCIPLKLPKLDLTADAEYVANLVNVNMWL